MSFNHFMPNNVEEKVVKNYQPIFPLIYDNKIGPYKSITSLKETIVLMRATSSVFYNV